MCIFHVFLRLRCGPRFGDVLGAIAMQHLLVVRFGLFVLAARRQQPSIQFGILERKNHLTGLNVITFEHIHLGYTSADLGSNAYVASFQRA